MEGVLDIGVEEVVICPYIPRRALIRLEEDLTGKVFHFVIILEPIF